MAYNASSNLITNLDASPPVHNEVGVSGARLRCSTDSFEYTPVTNDVVALFRLPTNARIIDIKMWWDDLGTTATADLGIYETDSTAIDHNYFATSLAMGVTTGTGDGDHVRFEASAAATSDINARFWELAGKTEDPGGHLDVALDFSAVSAGAAGSISFAVYYTVD